MCLWDNLCVGNNPGCEAPKTSHLQHPLHNMNDSLFAPGRCCTTGPIPARRRLPKQLPVPGSLRRGETTKGSPSSFRLFVHCVPCMDCVSCAPRAGVCMQRIVVCTGMLQPTVQDDGTAVLPGIHCAPVFGVCTGVSTALHLSLLSTTPSALRHVHTPTLHTGSSAPVLPSPFVHPLHNPSPACTGTRCSIFGARHSHALPTRANWCQHEQGHQ